VGNNQKFEPKWPLRGADLWHPATAKNLLNELPELVLLTFDSSLEQICRRRGSGVQRGFPLTINLSDP
jgi:hypothetical protein